MIKTKTAEGAPKVASRAIKLMSFVLGFIAGKVAAIKTPAVMLSVLGRVAAKSKV